MILYKLYQCKITTILIMINPIKGSNQPKSKWVKDKKDWMHLTKNTHQNIMPWRRRIKSQLTSKTSALLSNQQVLSPRNIIQATTLILQNPQQIIKTTTTLETTTNLEQATTANINLQLKENQLTTLNPDDLNENSLESRVPATKLFFFPFPCRIY